MFALYVFNVMKIIIIHGVHITTPAGGKRCVPPMINLLHNFDLFVTMANSDDLIAGYNQVAIH